MSKTELLYNKILKITMFVAVVSLILLIIDLFFAVTKQAIDCDGLRCSIDSSETFFSVTIWLFSAFVVVFIVIARIMLFLLTRENKLEDAASYKSRISEQTDSSDFSESKLYEDIQSNKISSKPIKVKKAKSTPKIGEVFSGAVDSTKDFFSTLKGKFNIAKAERAVKKEIRVGERAIRKEAQSNSTPKIKEVFSGAVDSTKDFFGTLKDKFNIAKTERAVKKEIKDGEKAIQKEAKATERKAIDAKKEVARLEKEEILAAEREVERVRLEALALEQAKKQEEQDILNAKEKDERDKEASLLAKLRANEVKERESIKAKADLQPEQPKEKEYFTRLNKTELIALVAEASDLSKAKCKLVVNTFIATIVEELGNGNDVTIGKFGKFKKVTVKEIKEVNPKTGKTKITPEENNVKFLPDKLFKEMITSDIETTSDKNLFTKAVMKDMTEDEVQEQLIKEDKSKEHLETKILNNDPVEKPLSKKEIKAQLKKEKKEQAAKIKEEKRAEAARIKEEKIQEAKRLEEIRLEEKAIQDAKDEELRMLAEKTKAIQDAKDEELRIKAEKAKAIQDAKDEKERIKAEKAKEKQEAKAEELRLKEKAIKDAEAKKAIQKAKDEALKEIAAKEKAAKDKETKQKEIAAKVVVIETQIPAKPKKPKEVKKTKADIIEYIETETGISKNKSNKFLKFFAEVVKEELAKGKDVNIPGFGLFTTIEMPAKEAVNPQTNKRIVVPAHHQARLRFDDKFKKKFEVK